MTAPSTPAPQRPRYLPGPGFLYRAIVSTPSRINTPAEPGLLYGSDLHERIVFFEGPFIRDGRTAHLQKLLCLMWSVEPNDLDIYNVQSERELLDEGWSGDDAGDLNLLSTGCGGELFGVGPDRIHYPERSRVDLYVSPRVRQRLDAALAQVDALRAKYGTPAGEVAP